MTMAKQKPATEHPDVIAARHRLSKCTPGTPAHDHAAKELAKAKQRVRDAEKARHEAIFDDPRRESLGGMTGTRIAPVFDNE